MSLHLKSARHLRGNLFINLILILTMLGLVAIVILQVIDLRKYIGH